MQYLDRPTKLKSREIKKLLKKSREIEMPWKFHAARISCLKEKSFNVNNKNTGFSFWGF